MVQVRTLTPSTKRVIHIPDELIGVSRYGSFSHVDQPTEHKVIPISIKPSYDPVPEHQKLDLPTAPKPKGLRAFDRTIGAYVLAPRPPLPAPVAPRPTVPPWGDTEGPEYWIVDRDTGYDLRKIRAQTAARAQQFAADFALANGFKAGDCYARVVC